MIGPEEGWRGCRGERMLLFACSISPSRLVRHSRGKKHLLFINNAHNFLQKAQQMPHFEILLSLSTQLCLLPTEKSGGAESFHPSLQV